MTAQLIYIIFVIIELMLGSYMHGKPKQGYHNVFFRVFDIIIITTVIYCGGFFDIN